MLTLSPSIRALASRLVLAACLCLPASAAAEPVFVTPEGPVPIGGFADVEIQGLEDKSNLAVETVPEIRYRAYAALGTGNPIIALPTNQAGTWTLVIAWVEDGKPKLKKIPLVIGTGPVPVPPGPTPVPPGPTPPVTVGKRTLLIVYEATASTVEFGQLTTTVRQPPHSTYIMGKGHKLAILDDDGVDETGQPSAILESWRPHFANMTLPVIFVLDQATGNLLHKQELPNTAKAADVIQILKEHGG